MATRFLPFSRPSGSNVWLISTAGRAAFGLACASRLIRASAAVDTQVVSGLDAGWDALDGDDSQILAAQAALKEGTLDEDADPVAATIFALESLTDSESGSAAQARRRSGAESISRQEAT